MKPLSWLTLRNLKKTLATGGADKPDLAQARRTAIQQAAPSNDPRLAPLLIEALNDDWMMVREAAVEALRTLRAPEAVEPLLEFLKSQASLDLKRTAGQALAELSDPRAILPLLELSHAAPQNRVWITSGIVKIGKPAVPVLVNCLKSPDAGIRLDAVVALGRLKLSEAAAPLLAMAGDSQPVVRAHVAEALGHLAHRSAVPVLANLLRDPDSGVRANAAAACVKLPDERQVPALKSLLADESDAVRGHAASALGTIGAVAAAPEIARLAGDPAEDVRLRAVEALGELNDSRTETWLLPLLRDSAGVRLKAIQVLGRLGTEASVEGLAATADDPHDPIRKAVVETLGKIGSSRAIPALTRALRRDRSTEVQLAAVRSLGQIGDAAALPALRDALMTGDFALRCRACVAVGEIRSGEGVEILLPLLQDPAAEIRYHAAVALGTIGDRRAVKDLELMTGEKDPLALRGVGKAFQLLGDARGEKIVEQAMSLSEPSSKPAPVPPEPAVPAAPVKATPRPVSSAPRGNLLKSVGNIFTSIGEIISAQWTDLEPAKKMAAIAVLIAIPLVAGGAWWFLRPSSATNNLLAATQRGNISSLAYCGPSTLAAATTNGFFELWDVEKESVALRTEVPGIQSLLGSPDGRTLAVFLAGGKLEFRDPAGDVVGTAEGLANAKAVQFKADGSRLALAGPDGTVVLMDARGGGRKSLKLEVEADKVASVAVSPSHEFAAYGLSDGRVQIFKLDPVETYATIRKGHDKAVVAITFARNSPTFATCGADGTTFIWDIQERKRLTALQQTSAPPSIMRLSPDGKLLARGYATGGIVVCDLDRTLAAKSRAEIAAAQKAMDTGDLDWASLDGFALSSDAQFLAAGSSDDLKIAVFDLKTGAQIKRLSPL